MEGCVAYDHIQAQEPVYQEIHQIATQEEMYDVYNYRPVINSHNTVISSPNMVLCELIICVS